MILCRGGDKGRGRHSKSFKKPLKNTPEARIWTNLYGLSTAASYCDCSTSLPSSHGGISAPEQNGKEYHKECMCTKVGDESEVCVERRVADIFLEDTKIRRLPSEEG